MPTKEPRDWLTHRETFGRYATVDLKPLGATPGRDAAIERKMAEIQSHVAHRFRRLREAAYLRSWSQVAERLQGTTTARHLTAVMRGERQMSLRLFADLSLLLGDPLSGPDEPDSSRTTSESRNVHEMSGPGRMVGGMGLTGRVRTSSDRDGNDG